MVFLSFLKSLFVSMKFNQFPAGFRGIGGLGDLRNLLRHDGANLKSLCGHLFFVLGSRFGEYYVTKICFILFVLGSTI